jgi:hypothetical protein
MSHIKFKVGDKVTIRPDLSKHTNCPVTGCYILACMWNHQGKTTTVAQVILEGNNTYYRLKIDNNNWSWTSFMFQQPLFKRKELP